MDKLESSIIKLQKGLALLLIFILSLSVGATIRSLIGYQGIIISVSFLSLGYLLGKLSYKQKIKMEVKGGMK